MKRSITCLLYDNKSTTLLRQQQAEYASYFRNEVENMRSKVLLQKPFAVFESSIERTLSYELFIWKVDLNILHDTFNLRNKRCIVHFGFYSKIRVLPPPYQTSNSTFSNTKPASLSTKFWIDRQDFMLNQIKASKAPFRWLCLLIYWFKKKKRNPPLNLSVRRNQHSPIQLESISSRRKPNDKQPKLAVLLSCGILDYQTPTDQVAPASQISFLPIYDYIWAKETQYTYTMRGSEEDRNIATAEL